MNHPKTETDLMAFFKALGITVTTHRHPPVFTVEEARSLRGDLAGGHCKTLLVRDKKKRHALIVADEQDSIDLSYVARQAGLGRISFASGDRLFDMLGIRPGAVTPFSLINRCVQEGADADLLVILDARMMEFDLLNYHPLHNAATTAIGRDDLLRFIHACGYEPMVMPMRAPDTE